MGVNSFVSWNFNVFVLIAAKRTYLSEMDGKLKFCDERNPSIFNSMCLCMTHCVYVSVCTASCLCSCVFINRARSCVYHRPPQEPWQQQLTIHSISKSCRLQAQIMTVLCLAGGLLWKCVALETYQHSHCRCQTFPNCDLWLAVPFVWIKMRIVYFQQLECSMLEHHWAIVVARSIRVASSELKLKQIMSQGVH